MNWPYRIKWYLQKRRIIKKAREYLIKTPYDLYHKLLHHQAVFENCKLIASEENLNVDIDILEIACFWHDVFKGYDNEDELLEKNLSGFDLK